MQRERNRTRLSRRVKTKNRIFAQFSRRKSFYTFFEKKEFLHVFRESAHFSRRKIVFRFSKKSLSVQCTDRSVHPYGKVLYIRTDNSIQLYGQVRTDSVQPNPYRHSFQGRFVCKSVCCSGTVFEVFFGSVIFCGGAFFEIKDCKSVQE